MAIDATAWPPRDPMRSTIGLMRSRVESGTGTRRSSVLVRWIRITERAVEKLQRDRRHEEAAGDEHAAAANSMSSGKKKSAR